MLYCLLLLLLLLEGIIFFSLVALEKMVLEA